MFYGFSECLCTVLQKLRQRGYNKFTESVGETTKTLHARALMHSNYSLFRRTRTQTIFSSVHSLNHTRKECNFLLNVHTRVYICLEETDKTFFFYSHVLHIKLIIYHYTRCIWQNCSFFFNAAGGAAAK